MASQNRTHASDRGKAVVDIPTVPTIGTATAGPESATIAFTASTIGGPATTYTALSNPGSITGTGSSSPVTVTGLTAGTAYTFTVRGNNTTGSSEYSVASNSITALVNPLSFESIATVTLGSTQTTISFSSIPSTFKHLQVRGIARGTFAATNLNLCMQVNSDTSNSYTTHQLLGDGASATASGQTAQAFGFVGRIAQANATSNTFGASVIDIIDYTNTNKNTTIRALGGYDANGNGMATLMSSAYIKTDAITSIQIFGNLGDLVAGSTFALYGIKG